MEKEQFWLICKNQIVWRDMHQQWQKEKIQSFRDKCKLYEYNKRRQRGMKQRGLQFQLFISYNSYSKILTDGD